MKRLWALIFLGALLFAQRGKEDRVRKLTDEEKIELLRGLTAEFATVKAFIPRVKRPVKIGSDGGYDKTEWREKGDEYGAVARVGEQVQITKVDIEDDRIVLQINGGLNTRGKWYERIEGGVGSSGRTVPMSRNITRSAGTTIALVFPGRIPPETKPSDVKKMLAPVLEFAARSAAESYFASLPPEIQEAIKANRAEVGMTPEQVKMALGHPRDRWRETVDGLEIEDWVYGYPPGKITFVTFANGKVIRVKDSYAGLGGQTVPMPPPPR